MRKVSQEATTCEERHGISKRSCSKMKCMVNLACRSHCKTRCFADVVCRAHRGRKRMLCEYLRIHCTMHRRAPCLAGHEAIFFMLVVCRLTLCDALLKLALVKLRARLARTQQQAIVALLCARLPEVRASWVAKRVKCFADVACSAHGIRLFPLRGL